MAITADGSSSSSKQQPVCGYGWVIVLASAVNHVIIEGICYTYGVFYIEFLEYFEESKSLTSLVGSILTGVYLLTAPLSSALVDKFGCRRVAIAGAVIATFGFAISRLSQSIAVLIITYGAIAGFGFGLLYLPSVVAVGHHFNRGRAVALGVGSCGAGLGMVVFPLVGRQLLSQHDWRNAILIVAGIALQGVVTGALLRPPESDLAAKLNGRTAEQDYLTGVRHSEQRSTTELGVKYVEKERVEWTHLNKDKVDRTKEAVMSETEAQIQYDLITNGAVKSPNIEKLRPTVISPDNRPVKSKFKMFVDDSGVSLFQHEAFVLLFVGNLFAMSGLCISLFFIADRAMTLGIDENQAALLLSVTGVTNTLSRVAVGFVAKYISPLLIHNIALFTAGLTCFFNAFAVDYPTMCVYCLVIGLCIGTWLPLTPVVLCDMLGAHTLTKSFGLLNISRGVAALFGPPIAGFVYDVTGHYDNSYHVAGTMFLIGGALCCGRQVRGYIQRTGWLHCLLTDLRHVVVNSGRA